MSASVRPSLRPLPRTRPTWAAHCDLRLCQFRGLQVFDFHVVPVVCDVVSDEATVAVVRRGLAAEQNRIVESLPRDHLLDLPLSDQLHELSLVVAPAPAELLVGVEHYLGRREKELVAVVHPAEFGHEVGQVIALGEAGKLRDVV